MLQEREVLKTEQEIEEEDRKAQEAVRAAVFWSIMGQCSDLRDGCRRLRNCTNLFDGELLPIWPKQMRS